MWVLAVNIIMLLKWSVVGLATQQEAFSCRRGTGNDCYPIHLAAGNRGLNKVMAITPQCLFSHLRLPLPVSNVHRTI